MENDKKVYESWDSDEINRIASKIVGVIEEYKGIPDDDRSKMFKLVEDARENFVWRVDYPKLTAQCFKCKHHETIFWDNWWCSARHETKIGCPYFEEGEHDYGGNMGSVTITSTGSTQASASATTETNVI